MKTEMYFVFYLHEKLKANEGTYHVGLYEGDSATSNSFQVYPNRREADKAYDVLRKGKKNEEKLFTGSFMVYLPDLLAGMLG